VDWWLVDWWISGLVDWWIGGLVDWFEIWRVLKKCITMVFLKKLYFRNSLIDSTLCPYLLAVERQVCVRHS